MYCLITFDEEFIKRKTISSFTAWLQLTDLNDRFLSQFLKDTRKIENVFYDKNVFCKNQLCLRISTLLQNTFKSACESFKINYLVKLGSPLSTFNPFDRSFVRSTSSPSLLYLSAISLRSKNLPHTIVLFSICQLIEENSKHNKLCQTAYCFSFYDNIKTLHIFFT